MMRYDKKCLLLRIGATLVMLVGLIPLLGSMGCATPPVSSGPPDAEVAAFLKSFGRTQSPVDSAVMALTVLAVPGTFDAASLRAALPYANRALELDPRSATMHLVRGAIRSQGDDIEFTISDINQAIALAGVPEQPFSVAELRSNPESQARFQRMFKQYLGEGSFGHLVNPESVIDQAFSLIGDNSRTPEAWTRIVRADPESALALLIRGFSAMQDKPTDQALYDIEHAVRKSGISAEQLFVFFARWVGPEFLSDDPDARLFRAIIHSAKQQDRAAVRELESMLARRPADPVARGELAWVLATSADPAVRDGRRALALALGAVQAEPSARNGRALAAALAEVGDYKGAAAAQRASMNALRPGADAREDYSVYLTAYEIGRPWRKDQ